MLYKTVVKAVSLSVLITREKGFIFYFTLYLYKMMDIHETYCDNYFS